jgi:two-component system, NarL family, sensor histidine kinase UhpB
VRAGVAFDRPRRMDGRTRRPRTLFWRLSVVNVSVLVAVAVLLALTPVTVSAPVSTTEIAILVVGLLLTTTANVLLVRRTLAPLRRLTDLMKSVDPMEPGRRVTGIDSRYEDSAALAHAFNAMLDRIELERAGSARRALGAQEGERLRIARELHDEVGQTLTAIALEAERTAEAGPGVDRDSWMRVAEWAQQSVEDLRRIARQLRPEALDELGLVNAFIALCNRVSDQAGIEIERQFSDRIPRLDPSVELAVYRVAQEALTNVMRHSEASTAVVSLEVLDGSLRLRVADNGRGIVAGEHAESKTGLAGMRERAMLVGGALTIRSGPDEGTEVVLEVPLTP